MRSYQIYLNDWVRIFLGEVPASFYLEIILRTAFIYLILMVSMRIMGKRMASQLSRNEMVAMTSLAAAIGVPILAPDRGLLPAVVIAVIVVAVQRIIARIAFQNQKFEEFAQDNFTILVEDGLTFPDRMRKNRISQERLFAQLRSEGVDHLGKVRRLYLEAGGTFTLIRQLQPLPGLSVMPMYDIEYRNRQKTDKNLNVCNTCGNRHPITQHPENDICERCGANVWVPAVIDS